MSGGAGVGKSNLAKTIHISISKVLLHKGGSPEKPRILLFAPTGAVAININGTIINTVLGINVAAIKFPLSDCKRATLHNKLLEVRFRIIDGISMSSMLFYQLHQKLNEIFGYSNVVAFAGIPVLVYGNFYQFPLSRGGRVYLSISSIKGCLSLDLWRKFLSAELTEVAKERGESDFIRLLKKI